VQRSGVVRLNREKIAVACFSLAQTSLLMKCHDRSKALLRAA
jgi:hypothetical protein